jgi:hypothetical protein
VSTHTTLFSDITRPVIDTRTDLPLPMRALSRHRYARAAIVPKSNKPLATDRLFDYALELGCRSSAMCWGVAADVEQALIGMGVAVETGPHEE